jgi:hypothetical protein
MRLSKRRKRYAIPAFILNPRARDPSQDSRLGVPLRLSPAIVQHRHRGLPRACLPRITLRPTVGAAQSAPPVHRRVPAPLRAPLRSVAHAASAPCATVPIRWRFSAPCWRRRASGTALAPPCPIRARRGGRQSNRVPSEVVDRHAFTCAPPQRDDDPCGTDDGGRGPEGGKNVESRRQKNQPGI